MLEMSMSSAAPELGVLGLQEQEPRTLLENPAETPTVFDRLRGAFSRVVEYVGDVSDRIPTPSAWAAARVGAGTLALVGGGDALASTANAKIVVGQSINGVKLGETQPQVQAALGQPASTNSVGNQGSAWFYSDRSSVGFNTALTVDSLVTYSSKQKTNKDIGVGSSLKATRKAYPKVKCESSAAFLGPGSAQCTIKTNYGGKPVLTVIDFRKPNAAEEVDVEFESAENN